MIVILRKSRRFWELDKKEAEKYNGNFKKNI